MSITDSEDELRNWGIFLINKVVHPFAIVATPLFILALQFHHIRVDRNPDYGGGRLTC